MENDLLKSSVILQSLSCDDLVASGKKGPKNPRDAALESLNRAIEETASISAGLAREIRTWKIEHSLIPTPSEAKIILRKKS